MKTINNAEESHQNKTGKDLSTRTSIEDYIREIKINKKIMSPEQLSKLHEIHLKNNAVFNEDLKPVSSIQTVGAPVQ